MAYDVPGESSHLAKQWQVAHALPCLARLHLRQYLEDGVRASFKAMHLLRLAERSRICTTASGFGGIIPSLEEQMALSRPDGGIRVGAPGYNDHVARDMSVLYDAQDEMLIHRSTSGRTTRQHRFGTSQRSWYQIDPRHFYASLGRQSKGQEEPDAERDEASRTA